MTAAALARRSRGAAFSVAVTLGGLAASPVEAPAQLLNLEEVWCELDPALDYCIDRRLLALVGTLERSVARDKATLFAFVGKYLTHRSDDDIRLYPPDPGYYDQFTNSDQIDFVIYILDLVFNPYGRPTPLGTPTWDPSEEQIAEANQHIAEMDPGLPRLYAYRYMADFLLRFGTAEMAAPYIAALADEIAAIESQSARIPYLSDLGWFQARAGMTEEALATAASVVAIAETHPIAQLRPIYAVEAAAAEGTAGGVELGAARIAAAQEALDAIPGAPPAFVALTTAIIARNYGRLGMLDEARASVEQALAMIDEIEPDQQPDFLRMLMEAGVY